MCNLIFIEWHLSNKLANGHILIGRDHIIYENIAYSMHVYNLNLQKYNIVRLILSEYLVSCWAKPFEGQILDSFVHWFGTVSCMLKRFIACLYRVCLRVNSSKNTSRVNCVHACNKQYNFYSLLQSNFQFARNLTT